MPDQGYYNSYVNLRESQRQTIVFAFNETDFCNVAN